MGFPLLGLLVAVAFLAPNLLYVLVPPRGPAPAVAGRVLMGLERAGQLGCLVALAPPSPTPPDGPPWALAALVACGIAYYSLWIRYLTSGRTWELLLGPALHFPVPMAALPVAAFAFTAAWQEWWPLGAATAVLAAGHLPISWQGWKGLRAQRRLSSRSEPPDGGPAP